ncbi:MAG: hypothetical protein ACM31K_01590 [Solirubrobacterales bacterium]
MSSIRKRFVAGVVVLALGGLGGVAWANNPAAQHATPASTVSTQQGGSNTRPVTTGTSGAVATPAVNTQPFPGATSVGGRRDD